MGDGHKPVPRFISGSRHNRHSRYEAEWAAFVAEIVTPRFPDGLSVLNVEGQHRDPAGRIIRERTKLLVVVVFDAPAHHAKVGEIVAAYNRRFGQHGVFRAEHPVCAGG